MLLLASYPVECWPSSLIGTSETQSRIKTELCAVVEYDDFLKLVCAVILCVKKQRW